MRKNYIFEVSCSEFLSPIVMAPKPDGTQRLCVVYFNVNSVVKSGSYHIPWLEDYIEVVGQANSFSKLDLIKDVDK